VADLEKKKVVVLGGTGFVGSGVLRALAAYPLSELLWMKRAEAVSPLAVGLSQPKIIEDLEAVELSWFRDADVIIDLVSRGRGRMVSQRDINLRIRPHLRIIDGLINSGSKAHYILLSSGGAIYGNTSSRMLSESSPCLPNTEYGLEKAIIELHLLAAAQTTLKTSILRVTNAYGVGQPTKPGFGVIPALVNALETGEAFPIFGSGEMQRDYINVIDVVGAVEAAIRHGGVGITNIGTGCGTSINELVSLVQELSGRKVNAKYIETNDSDPNFAQLSISRARELLKWEPTVRLRHGLSRILDEKKLLR